MECRLSNAQIITMANQSTEKFKGKRRGAIESLKKKTWKRREMWENNGDENTVELRFLSYW